MKIFVLILLACSLQANCSAQSVDQRRWIEENMVRNVFDLAKNSTVRRELEIADFQLQELTKLKAEYIKGLERLSEETRSFSKREAERARTKIWEEIHDSTIKKLDEILLPHQFQRLKQIAKQGPIRIGAKGDRFKMYVIMARQLGLSEKEIKLFEEKVAKEKIQYQKKLANLAKETDQAVFQHLPAKTRARLNEAFGEIYLPTGSRQ